MNYEVCLLFLLYFSKRCVGVIYYLNDTEYDKMPPLFHMEDYEGCIQQVGALYCTAQLSLVSDTPSDLLHMIKEYSEHKTTHFNHSNLRYSICMAPTTNLSTTCSRYTVNTSEVSATHLEGCLNESMWNRYELRAKVSSYDCHGNSDKSIDIEVGDIVMCCVLLSILIVNFVGTIKEIYSSPNSRKEYTLLSCFAIQRNWRKLTWNSSNLEPRLQRLKGIHCIRFVILAAMILTHCMWPHSMTATNLRAMELGYNSIPQHIMISGSTALQSYLVLSTFLLVYKLELIAEKHDVNWTMVPIGIVLRYIRLTPALAVVLGLSATWLKFLRGGPLWLVSGALEVADCNNRFWAHIFYFHNYFYNAQCMIQSWYLAVDTQLYCFALVVYMAIRHSEHKRIILTTLFFIGILIPALLTCYHDLDAIFIVYPEQTKILYGSDPTFNEVYKRGHTNAASCITGMALGYLVYRWQEANIYINKYKKCRFVYWTILPLMVLVVISGSVFYRDAPRDALFIRVLYGALAKPFMGILMAAFICGMIFKLENFYRRILELRIWVVPSRLSYCTFLVHFSFFRIYVSMATKLKPLGPYDPLITFAWAYPASLITALPLWLLVETPFTELTKYALHKIKGPETQKREI